MPDQAVTQYGVPLETNDKILELMGGCRHDWKPDTGEHFTCRICHLWLRGELPKVVDGHAVSFTEMLEWQMREWGYVSVNVTGDTGTWFVQLSDNPSVEGATATAALAEAIVQAYAAMPGSTKP